MGGIGPIYLYIHTYIFELVPQGGWLVCLATYLLRDLPIVSTVSALNTREGGESAQSRARDFSRSLAVWEGTANGHIRKEGMTSADSCCRSFGYSILIPLGIEGNITLHIHTKVLLPCLTYLPTWLV